MKCVHRESSFFPFEVLKLVVEDPLFLFFCRNSVILRLLSMPLLSLFATTMVVFAHIRAQCRSVEHGTKKQSARQQRHHKPRPNPSRSETSVDGGTIGDAAATSSSASATSRKCFHNDDPSQWIEDPHGVLMPHHLAKYGIRERRSNLYSGPAVLQAESEDDSVE